MGTRKIDQSVIGTRLAELFLCIPSLDRVRGLARWCDLSHRERFRLMPHSSNSSKGVGDMENPSLVLAISKLAVAGEQAGFTLEQMIDLLDAGVEVETLLELIGLRLYGVRSARARSLASNWVM